MNKLALSLLLVAGYLSAQQTVNGVANQTVTGTAGGGLPTATAPGQIITSSAAGTTYAVQGQVFYSQSGDTIASIETECSSLCTYVVTVPQTITLAASHTLNANVNLQFTAGGKWTINGATFTLTIPGQISGSLSQHFVIGTGLLTLGVSNTFIPVEWLGAVGDWNGSTGTDNTTPIQNTLNALTAGQAILRCANYKVTAAISITKSNVGVGGSCYGTIGAGLIPSTLVTTNASADVLDVTGSSGSFLSFNKFTNFSITSTVIPTGTAAGMALNFVGGAIIQDVQVFDRVIGFYLHAVPSLGSGYINDDVVTWCKNGVSETSGTYYGFYLDSADGNPQNSILMNFDGAASDCSGITSYGMIVTGSAINDVETNGFGTAKTSYGQVLNYTGSGSSIATTDIHLRSSTLDGCGISCYKISGLTVGTGASVEIIGGWVAPSLTSGTVTSLIDIESSAGVSVIGVQLNQPVSSETTSAINAVSSSNLIIANNNFSNSSCTNPILLSSTNDSTVSGNKIFNATGCSATVMINLTGTSSWNVISGNTISGFATTGVTFGSSTTHNTLLDSTAIDTTNIGTATANTGTSNTIGTGSGGGNTTSSSLASNVMPKANGTNSIINSSLTDNGTTVTTSDAGGYVGPTYTSNGTTAGFIDYAAGTTSASVAPCNTSASWCVQAPSSLSGNFIETLPSPATGVIFHTLSGTTITDTIIIPYVKPVVSAISSATGGSGTGTVTCLTAACTNISGTYSVVGGTFTTGTFLTLVWPTTTTAYNCWVTQNGGIAYYGMGNGVATATGMTVTAGISIIGITAVFSYGCSSL